MGNQFIILCALLVFIFWSLFVSPYLVSSTRQKLFAIRDKVFLDFEHDKGYQEFRTHINLFIRFATKASWQRMLFDLIMLRKELKQSQPSRIEFDNSELKRLHFLSALLIIRLIVLRSPTMMLFSTLLFLLVVVRLEILPRIRNIATNFVIKDANIYTAQLTT